MIKTKEEIEKMRVAGKHLGRILKALSKLVKPGVLTEYLNAEAEKEIEKIGGVPSFKNYKSPGLPPMPSSLLTSINEEIVHSPALPGRVLKEGDIVSLDLGFSLDGMYVDSAITIAVGKVSGEAEKLIKVTKKSLELGLKQVKPGNTVGHFGQAVQEYAESYGFGVVRELVGHGVGRSVHEAPQVPNYGREGEGATFKPGMTLAFEPMITLGKPRVKFHERSWFTTVADGSLCVHFEHTVLVTDKGYEILT